VAHLHIDVDLIGNQTTSWSALPSSGKISFHNKMTDPTRILTIEIEPADQDVLCQNNTVKHDFTVQAGATETLKICGGYQGDFKYTAEIQGSTPEDPRIIIKDYKTGEVALITTVVIAAVTAFIGAAAAGLWMRWRQRRVLRTT
jgi:hypothetical protein